MQDHSTDNPPQQQKMTTALPSALDRFQEIADRLNVPVGTVRSRIHRGRALMRKRLT